MTITLKLKEVINPGPNEIHVYIDVNSNNMFSLQAGKNAFTWNSTTDCPILYRNREKIIAKYVEHGLNQHRYAGGWNEAISKLTIEE